MRTLAVLVLAIASLAACASPNRPQRFSRETFRDATWGDLIGLSQDEIRVRLGMPATGETLGSLGAWLEDGAVVSEGFTTDLVRSACAADRNGYRAATRFSRMLRLTFRDGVLAGVADPSPRKLPIAMEEPVNATCEVARTRTLTEELGYGQGAMLLAVPFIAPFVLPQVWSDDDWRKAQLALYGGLRLGEPPPGGLDAFVAGRLQEVRAVELADGATELNFRMHNASRLESDYKAVVRDGRVVALRPSYDTCLLRPDRSLACGQRRFF